MDNPVEILKKARKAKGLSQEAMAEKLGLSMRMYQRYEDGNFPKYKSENIRAIDKLLGTNLCDIIYDTNVPRESVIKEPNGNHYLNERLNNKNSDNPYLVPFVDLPALAGYVKAYDQIDYIHTLKRYPILPDVDPHGAIWRYFQIDGDSMEPEFRHGDVILTSQVPKEDWNQFSNLYSYVIVTDTNLWFKDVDRVGLDGKWILLSQNEAYDPFTVNIQEVKQLWVMRRHVKARAKKHRLYNLEEIRKQLKK